MIEVESDYAIAKKVNQPMEKNAGPRPDVLDIIHFIQNNVLNVSEVTRTTKLSEILDSYAENKSHEIYVIQNTRNKKSRGVFMDLEYFTELLTIKNLVDQSADDIVEHMALQRVRKTADKDLRNVGSKLDLSDRDIADIIKLAELDP